MAKPMKFRSASFILQQCINKDGSLYWKKNKMKQEKYFITKLQIAILNSIDAEDRTKVLIEIMENQKMEKKNVRKK